MQSIHKFAIIFLFSSPLFLTSCATTGSWPQRTRDPQILIEGNKSYLSDKDLTLVHELVWSKNPNLRILGIEVINRDKILLTCTTQAGEKFTKMIGFDLIRSGSGWSEGTYKSVMRTS
jgi:hypothetical protein